MSNYTSTANVVLSVNGKQATQMLAKLQKEAATLEKKIAKAATAGDKATMKKLQRELTATNKLIQQMQGSATTADNVLRRLDKATPRELQRTLKTLQQQLNGIARDSAAWDAQVAKIKAVKAELQKVNSAMNNQRSLWERMNMWLNNCQTAILGIGAAVTGLVMAGKSAVTAYAEMEQEMANVRKFTGMTAEQVEALNEELKKIDTRSSREELNRLAQEAGRLGKSSMEDVLGFVRAADKINVALDDLGEGATLTLSKLTGIFGDEERLGTEKSLLAVGSVINELSQNCSASAPYLAEFASRMGGVGAQANLSIQQIMGFAAVLDSNNQKVEASATAIAQVLTRMYQDPAKYAKPAGLEVSEFTKLLKEDANAALIHLLETLNKMGNMDVLSPIFADMGENGARAISALSTLAKNIDEVKSQQLVANLAFEEAVSVGKEFDVQNNTVQAGLDKAKKGFNEMAVELGQKLAPLMKHVISSSSVFLRVLSSLIDFIGKHTAEIVTITTAFVAYQLAVHASTLAFKAHYAWVVLTQKEMALLQGTTMVLKMGFYVLTGQINKAKAAYTAFHLLTKSTPWGFILSAITAITVGIMAWTKRTNELKKAQEQQRKEQAQQLAGMRDISDATAQFAEKEMTQLKLLYDTATDEAKSKDERKKAALRLQAIYPDYFKNLSTEEIMVGNAKTAYDKLRDSIIDVARAKAAATKIQENESKLLDLEAEEAGLKEKRDKAKVKYDNAVSQWETDRELESMRSYGNSTDAAASGLVNVKPSADKVAETGKEYEAAESAYQANITQQSQLKAANEELKKKYNVTAETLAANDNLNPDPTFTPTPTTEVATDKFAEEKEWRTRQEASARISYATGETDYIAYTKRMDEIAVQFCEKQLLHTDLTETERLTITADYREAQKQQQEHFNAQSVEAEQTAHNEKLAELKQFYIDGSISKETYDQKTEEAEIEHQRKLVNLTKQGSKERAEADAQLQNLLIQQMQRRQAETERKEREYAQMKSTYFGDNPQEKQKKYDTDLAALQVVYERELRAAGNNADEKLRIDEAYEKAKLALQKKYGLLAEEDNRSRAEKMTADVVEWFESDGGQALTGTLDTLVSGMSAIFSQLSSLMQAELEIQTAAINKRYDAEISRAEGNSYQVAKLEKQKQKELAKAKNEANKKMFAMQVIQAVAQTAQNAISAYGSAAAIPLVGYILAPIAAAMAVAAGAIQIAAIKKQQQASEAQGYSEGGFTPDGDKDQAVGVVHAGEWVASQKLVKNPKTRPLLEALDYAQRNNTIGSLTPTAVSAMMPGSVGAMQSTIQQSPQPNVVVNVPQAAPDTELSSAINKLNTRLNEPFVTVNTVSGDHGINQAQEEYDRLMRNKTPKSKR